MSLLRRRSGGPAGETRLVLHIGLPKTATSAIQHVLSAAAEPLAEVGIHIPHVIPEAAQGLVTAGNGATLYAAVRADPDPVAMRRAATQWFEGALAPGEVTLVSSELLGTLPPEAVRAVVDAASSLATVDVVAFVRDVYEHAYAAWGQQTKEGLNMSFTEFCDSEYRREAEQTQYIDRWVEGFPDLVVRHYGTHRDDVLPTLFEAVGIELPAPLRDWPVPRVNRSLDHAELELIRIINAVGRDQQMTRLIADTLSRGLPEKQPVLPIIAPVLSMLHRLYDAPVTALNRRFFGGAPVLTIEPDSRTQSEELARPAVEAELVVRFLAEMHFGERPATGGAVRGAIRILARVDEWQWGDERHRSDPAIPPDFDPVGYLLANADVLEAGVDPYQHYLSSGRSEGRQWRHVLA